MAQSTQVTPDTLAICDRHLQPTTAWRDAFSGSAFLVCGGPSFTPALAAAVTRRGVFSLAVNGVAAQAGYRPSAFVCSDPPSKFHNGIWQDPNVIKFIPVPKFSSKRGRNLLRAKVGDKFVPLLDSDGNPANTNHMSNIWGYARRGWLQTDDTFFSDSEAAWGNGKAGAARTGQPTTYCTMLIALRLLYHLGFRRVFLLGVDFLMRPGLPPAANYSFGELRDADAIKSNNAQFAIVNKWLCDMVSNGTFANRGYAVYNCNPVSALRAFPHVPFAEALALTLNGFPTEPLDCEGWYKK